MLPAVCIDGRFVLASSQGSGVTEAYSDIFAVSAGFFHEPNGATGTYAYGSDYAAGSLRDHVDPWSQNYPGSYRYRYEFALARMIGTGTTPGQCSSIVGSRFPVRGAATAASIGTL